MSATLRRLLRARDRIHSSYDEGLTLDELARTAGLSRYFFLRSFAQTFGRTPHDYLTDVRIHEAKRRLARGQSVTEVCLAVGLSSVGSFSSLFKRRTGSAPAVWQQRVRTWVTVTGDLQPLWVPGCFLEMFAGSNFGEAGRTSTR